MFLFILVENFTKYILIKNLGQPIETNECLKINDWFLYFFVLSSRTFTLKNKIDDKMQHKMLYNLYKTIFLTLALFPFY